MLLNLLTQANVAQPRADYAGAQARVGFLQSGVLLYIFAYLVIISYATCVGKNEKKGVRVIASNTQRLHSREGYYRVGPNLCLQKGA